MTINHCEDCRHWSPPCDEVIEDGEGPAIGECESRDEEAPGSNRSVVMRITRWNYSCPAWAPKTTRKRVEP